MSGHTPESRRRYPGEIMTTQTDHPFSDQMCIVAFYKLNNEEMLLND